MQFDNPILFQVPTVITGLPECWLRHRKQNEDDKEGLRELSGLDRSRIIRAGRSMNTAIPLTEPGNFRRT